MKETRTVTQTKYYKLILNPMRGRTEEKRIVIISDDLEKLKEYYNSKKVEYYRDDNWSKTFEKGSILEWYNPQDDFPNTIETTFGHGIEIDWAQDENVEKYCKYHDILLLKS